MHKYILTFYPKTTHQEVALRYYEIDNSAGRWFNKIIQRTFIGRCESTIKSEIKPVLGVF